MITGLTLRSGAALHRMCWLVVVACAMVMHGRADAAPTAGEPIVVLETYVGKRPEDIARYMNPLRDELERHGFTARPERVKGLMERHRPASGIRDTGKTSAEIRKLIEAGYEDFTNAQFEQAVRKLTEAIAAINRNPALLVADASNQVAVHKAYVGLALSQSRSKQDDQATATMTELIRLVRAQPLSRTEHGPTAEQFARTVYKQVSSKGRGRLQIDTGSPRAMIFVDRQFRGVGKAQLDDLIPGVYRVLVQEPQTAGLQYEADVPENGDVKLDLTWDLDSSLTTSPWVGIVFASDAERRKEAAYAASLGQRWTGRAMAAVIGTATLRGKPALIGTLYTGTGKALRSALLALDQADGARLTSLARFLADGKRSSGLDIVVTDVVMPVTPVRRSPWPGRLLVAGGVAAMVSGGVLIAIDEDMNDVGPSQPTYRNTRPAGVALVATGAVVTAVGTWLWVRSGRRSSVPIVAVGRSSAMIGWARRF